ncbi:Thioredoxin peroxidase [Granulibacter bethesdensis]|nr:Thioredoxin peroxidase [Granulibacter bethesdensis]
MSSEGSMKFPAWLAPGFLAGWVALTGLTTVCLSENAQAELAEGQQAPDFSLEAALAGKTFRFSLAEALRRGPVVVYFYPAAFTSGCTQEAHDFAEAMPRFKAQNATVIGVSGDALTTLEKFSESACGGKFAVAADPDRTVLRQYQVLPDALSMHATRTSYVIVPGAAGQPGRIIYVYTDGNPEKHVSNTLHALQQWQSHPSGHEEQVRSH